MHFKNHKCDLGNKRHPTNASYFIQKKLHKKLYNKFRSFFYLWEKHYRLKLLFRSKAAIETERKRHQESKYSFVIHPFSMCNYITEILTLICWTIAFFVDPFTAAYDPGFKLVPGFWILSVTIDIILLFFCFLSFLTGYVNRKTNETVIDIREVIKRYLTSYFIFDFFGSLPFNMILGEQFYMNIKYIIIFAWLHVIRFVRIKTLLRRFRQIFEAKRIDRPLFMIFCLILLIIYQLHIWSCVLYFCSAHLHHFIDIQNNWADDAFDEDDTPFKKYIETLHTTVAYFIRADNVRLEMVNDYECVIATLILITGIWTSICLLAVLFSSFSSKNISESSYMQMIMQLKAFSKEKNLPLHFQSRLISHYETVYQKKYFQVDAIVATLSESIQSEIIIHDCRVLINTIKLYKNFSKDSIEKLLEICKREYYLPNEVIFTHHVYLDSLFLISYGTVVIYYYTGEELVHFVDGDVFGDVAYLRNGIPYTNAIAAEICEVLVVNVDDFERISLIHPELKTAMLRAAEAKLRKARYTTGELQKSQKQHLEELVQCIENKQKRDEYDYDY